MVLRATKGYSPEHNKWIIPVRRSWGLAKNQRLTPTVQRKISCTAVETGSFEKASSLATQWKCPISDDAIRSCVLALGKKAEAHPLSSPCENQAGPKDVLIIMMDGWMARHRGEDWGKKRHTESQERVHWHEIKSAIIYRLADQAELSSKRRALVSKHVVATPAETDPVDFGQQVQYEAIRMGLRKAASVYIVMDGGIWLWNIFKDRFRQCAKGTLDFYHASEHIHQLAAALFPENRQEANTWSAKILHSLKHYSNKRLFKTLAELLENPPREDEPMLKVIESASNYFNNHKDHMNYAAAKKKGLPIGSGSIESQCSQFQDRFKRTGQFWSKEGFAALLQLKVRHQNNEFTSLWAA
jgi:hypothetical protein